MGEEYDSLSDAEKKEVDEIADRCLNDIFGDDGNVSVEGDDFVHAHRLPYKNFCDGVRRENGLVCGKVVHAHDKPDFWLLTLCLAVDARKCGNALCHVFETDPDRDPVDVVVEEHAAGYDVHFGVDFELFEVVVNDPVEQGHLPGVGNDLHYCFFCLVFFHFRPFLR